MIRSLRFAAILSSLVVLAIAMTAASAVAAPSKTLDNLQAAFNGESNANAKYLEFAKKADQEGYAGVAALFRAAAKAEEFHARNHGDVIKKMGAVPKADIKLPAIKTTAENVKAALEGETYEKDKMYPEFITEAKAAGEKDALKSFNYAIAAETQHAKFYADAMANLQAWKTAKTFLVCPICGNTVTTVDFPKCPVCFTPGEKFVSVS
ncbi:MAG: ferritin-like domain-containing protein [Acidobacteria bacterium]|nr:ferritin-like domain-containing protein [Acidobacteriota bacterium]